MCSEAFNGAPANTLKLVLAKCNNNYFNIHGKLISYNFKISLTKIYLYCQTMQFVIVKHLKSALHLIFIQCKSKTQVFGSEKHSKKPKKCLAKKCQRDLVIKLYFTIFS